MNLSNNFLALVGFISFTCLAITAHADPTDLSAAMKTATQKSDAPSPTSGKVCAFTVQGLPGKFSDSTAAITAAESAGIGTPVLVGTCRAEPRTRQVRATKLVTFPLGKTVKAGNLLAQPTNRVSGKDIIPGL